MLLPTDWLALAGCVLFGLLIARLVLLRPRWIKALGFTLAGLVWLIHLLDACLDYVWVWLVPHPVSTILMLCAVWPALIAVLAGLIQYLPRSRDKRALSGLATVIALYAIYTLAFQLAKPAIDPRSWWEADTLMQSTSSTCIAAAAATYLRTLGVNLSETQAARRGMISDAGGTQTQAWRILRLSLPDEYRIRIGPVTRAAFSDGHWRVVSLRYAQFVGHAVVARMPQPDTVTLRDPLVGEYTMQWDEFQRSYLGVGVWAEKSPAPLTASSASWARSR